MVQSKQTKRRSPQCKTVFVVYADAQGRECGEPFECLDDESGKKLMGDLGATLSPSTGRWVIPKEKRSAYDLLYQHALSKVDSAAEVERSASVYERPNTCAACKAPVNNKMPCAIIVTSDGKPGSHVDAIFCTIYCSLGFHVQHRHATRKDASASLSKLVSMDKRQVRVMAALKKIHSDKTFVRAKQDAFQLVLMAYNKARLT
jgi:hypothetical protein